MIHAFSLMKNCAKAFKKKWTRMPYREVQMGKKSAQKCMEVRR